MKIIAILGAAAAALYLVLHRSGGAAAVQAGHKNAGIGGAVSKAGGVSAFPIGSIAQSFASIGSSIFGGNGTHAPVDPSIRSASATGGMVTSYDQLSSPVPEPSVIQTQLDGYDTGAPFVTQDASVGASDFGVDAGYMED